MEGLPKLQKFHRAEIRDLTHLKNLAGVWESRKGHPLYDGTWVPTGQQVVAGRYLSRSRSPSWWPWQVDADTAKGDANVAHLIHQHHTALNRIADGNFTASQNLLKEYLHQGMGISKNHHEFINKPISTLYPMSSLYPSTSSTYEKGKQHKLVDEIKWRHMDE
jgi:hypothetical protein